MAEALFKERARAIADLFSGQGNEATLLNRVASLDCGVQELGRRDETRAALEAATREVATALETTHAQRVELGEHLWAVDCKVQAALFEAKALLASNNTKFKVALGDVVPYARRVTYTSRAPPGWRMGVDDVRPPFKTPAPLSADMKVGLLFTDPEELFKMALEKKKLGKSAKSVTAVASTGVITDAGAALPEPLVKSIAAEKRAAEAVAAAAAGSGESEAPPLKKRRVVGVEPDSNTEERKILTSEPISRPQSVNTQPKDSSTPKKKTKFRMDIFDSDSSEGEEEG